MGDAAPRRVARPRIRRRLRVIALGLVLLPTLAIGVLVRAVAEADREAQQRDARERRLRVQGRAEDLAARLAARPELFPKERREHRALLEAARPVALSRPVDVDGDCGDWRAAGLFEASACEAGLVRFDRPELVAGDGAAEPAAYDPADLSFALGAGTREEEGYLYLFLRVRDDDFRVRRGGLATADQLRLVAAVPWGRDATTLARFASAFEAGGDLTTYQVGPAYSREVPPEERLTWGDYRAPAWRRPYGVWRRTDDGYDLELRLPLRSLGERWREAELGLAVVDVDAEDGALARQAMWVVPRRPGAIAPLAPDAERFRAAWSQLGVDPRDRRVAVLDARDRELFARFDGDALGDAERAVLDGRAERTRLEDRGNGPAARRLHSEYASLQPSEAALATAEIRDDRGRLLGTVVEADAGGVGRPRLLAALRESPVLAAMLGGALLLLFLLLWDTRRLSRRILALVDDVGADCDAEDEIGELSRRLSDLVERVRADKSYLERLPAILGHETLGPLGVVKMHLGELEGRDLPRQEAARRALRSIEELIEDLREATSLEDALSRGERARVDLVELVRDTLLAYGEARRAAITADLPDAPFPTTVIEGRIEQLLDKLLDNAVEFSEGGPVRVSLACADGEARLRVENEGPPLPEGPAAEQLFEPMWSQRKRTSERHLGMGLYVARIITEHHGGALRAWNAERGRVVFEATLREAVAPDERTAR